MKRLSVVLVTSVLSLLPAVAYAQQPSLADRETARSLMDEGDKKRDSGDMKAALKSYEAADAIMKVPTTGLEVARAQVALGMLLEARETLGRVVRIPVKAGEPPPFAAARKAADQMNNDLAARIPSIQVVVANADPAVTPQISVDNEPIPPAAASAPRKVNPGAHVVVVKAGSVEKKADVSVVERENKTVSVDLKDQVATPPPPPPKPVEKSEGGGAGKVLMYGGFGVGILGIGVGSVTGIMSISKTSSLKDQCPNNNCPPGKQDEIDSAKGLGNIATVAFIVGGVGVGVGVVGLLLSSGDKKEPAASAAQSRDKDRKSAKPFSPEHVRAVLGPSYVGLAGAF